MDRKKYRQVEDMSQLVIYWEPHNFPRTEIPFLAQWLESERIKGRIFTTRRNNLVWFGSIYINGIGEQVMLTVTIGLLIVCWVSRVYAVRLC